LVQPDQHGGFAHAEAAGRVAEEAEQRRYHKNHQQRQEADRGRRGQQRVHGELADAEIEKADADLHEGDRGARQHDLPVAASDRARRGQEP